MNNPFSMAQDLDLDILRETLHSCRSSSELHRDSDWMYQTKDYNQKKQEF
jgi:hypothetical protein